MRVHDSTEYEFTHYNKIANVLRNGPLHFTKRSPAKEGPVERFRTPWQSKKGRNQIWARVGTWKNFMVETASEIGLETPTGLQIQERPLQMEGHSPTPTLLSLEFQLHQRAPAPSHVFRRHLQTQGSDTGDTSAVQFAKFGLGECTGEIGSRRWALSRFPSSDSARRSHP